MPGVFEDLDFSPNDLELARRAAQAAGGYIDLTSSNPTHQGLQFPAAILQAAAASYWEARRYDPDPRGAMPARQAVADYYASRTPALALDPEAIFLTASTSEAYALLFALLCDPGDNMLAPVISYPLFEYLAALRDVELRPYGLHERDGWAIDQRGLLAAADARTRAVLLVSPHNPTGMVVQAALPALDRLGLPLICDEVFAAFPYRASHVPPLGALHPALPVFHLNGISKLFGLPDLKLGWIALNTPAAARFGARLELLNDTFLGASGLVQHMLPRLFAEGLPFVDAMRARIHANLDMALARLHGAGLDVQPPDGGYYLFPAVDGIRDELALALRLVNAGVLVHPGSFYGYERGAHLMISCLTARQQLAAGLDRLVEVLAGYVVPRVTRMAPRS